MEGFFEKYRQKIIEKSHLARNHECFLWDQGTTKDGKYGLISFLDPISGTWKKKKAHRFSYMVYNNYLELNKIFDASHLCHNSLCVNAAHINLEPHHINNNRIYCKHRNSCQGHANYPDCRLDLFLEDI